MVAYYFTITQYTLLAYLPLPKVIIDFTLVLGIDSSAAQAIVKLKDQLSHQLGTKLVIFVPGSAAGFPCEINISEQLNTARNFSGSCVCEDLDQALIYAEVRNYICECMTSIFRDQQTAQNSASSSGCTHCNG